jgi:hypothetical protein
VATLLAVAWGCACTVGATRQGTVMTGMALPAEPLSVASQRRRELLEALLALEYDGQESESAPQSLGAMGVVMGRGRGRVVDEPLRPTPSGWAPASASASARDRRLAGEAAAATPNGTTGKSLPLNGVHFRVGVVIDPPLVMKHAADGHVAGNQAYSGLIIDILQMHRSVH